MAGRQRTRVVRSVTEWTASGVSTAFSALAANTSVLDQSLSLTEPTTILRTRGIFSVVTDQVAATEEPFGAIGMCVVSDQALAVGVTAIPTPYTDAISDLWFLHQYWAAASKVATGAGFDTRAGFQYQFDSKAMRKISTDQAIAVMVENNDATAGCVYKLDFRMLLKLS